MRPCCAAVPASIASGGCITQNARDVPEGYRAMNEREVLKFQIKP